MNGMSSAWLVHGVKTPPLRLRSAPPARRWFGPANPGLRCASPWAIFVFSLRETWRPMLSPFEASSPGARR